MLYLVINTQTKDIFGSYQTRRAAEALASELGYRYEVRTIEISYC